jgi:hypothetical protein
LAITVIFSINTFAADNFNSANGQLTIGQVVVGNAVYTNVVVTVGSVVSIGNTPSSLTYDTFNGANGQLTIPSVLVSGKTYNNVVITVGSVISIGGQSALMPYGNPTQYVLNSGFYRSYTGNYLSTQIATFSLTTPTPLSANLSNVDISSAISTINYDDGLNSGTLENSSIVPKSGSTVLASTDSSGNITNLELSIASPQAPHPPGVSINNLDVIYYNGYLTVNVKNNSKCLTVGSNGFCSNTSPAQSTAYSVGNQTVTQISYPNYSQMFVFSDSDNDTGRRLLLEGIPLSPYWQGRHSNGPVAVEYFASNLGIPFSKRTNYAVGGAYTGRGNADSSPLVAKTGMLDQFDTFAQSLGTAQADPNALYFVRGGANDFTSCGKASCTTSQVAAMNSNISTLIKNLASKGAKHFYLSGLSSGTGNFRVGFNSQLAIDAALLSKTLGVDITFFDYANFNTNTSVLPNSFGFAYLSPAGCWTGGFTGTGGTLCNNVWAYTIWDTQQSHITSRFARLAGNSMSNQIIISQ